MLKKLMKHEWYYLRFKMLIALFIIAASTVVGLIIAKGALSIKGEPTESQIVLLILGLLAYYTIVMAVVYGFQILSGIRFYKNVYGDESYITHTLPATAREIHLSKVIVYTLCSAAISLLIMISIISTFYYALASEADAAAIFAAFNELTVHADINVGAWMPLLIAMLIVSGFANTMMVFGAIVLGQYWKKHRILGAIVWYIIIYILMGIIGTIATLPVALVSNLEAPAIQEPSAATEMMFSIFVAATLISLVVGAILYIISDYGITKRLDLE